jgi:hypothetical protein
MCLSELENPLLEVTKYDDVNCIDDVGLRQVAHDTGSLSKYVQSLRNME